MRSCRSTVVETPWSEELWLGAALQRHNTEKSKEVFPEKELRGLWRPNFHIHVSVSDLYILTIGLAYSAAGKYVG
jgi:hypothetical protein